MGAVASRRNEHWQRRLEQGRTGPVRSQPTCSGLTPPRHRKGAVTRTEEPCLRQHPKRTQGQSAGACDGQVGRACSLPPPSETRGQTRGTSGMARRPARDRCASQGLVDQSDATDAHTQQQRHTPVDLSTYHSRAPAPSERLVLETGACTNRVLPWPRSGWIVTHIRPDSAHVPIVSAPTRKVSRQVLVRAHTFGHAPFAAGGVHPASSARRRDGSTHVMRAYGRLLTGTSVLKPHETVVDVV